MLTMMRYAVLVTWSLSWAAPVYASALLLLLTLVLPYWPIHEFAVGVEPPVGGARIYTHWGRWHLVLPGLWTCLRVQIGDSRSNNATTIPEGYLSWAAPVLVVTRDGGR